MAKILDLGQSKNELIEGRESLCTSTLNVRKKVERLENEIKEAVKNKPLLEITMKNIKGKDKD